MSIDSPVPDRLPVLTEVIEVLDVLDDVSEVPGPVVQGGDPASAEASAVVPAMPVVPAVPAVPAVPDLSDVPDDVPPDINAVVADLAREPVPEPDEAVALPVLAEQARTAAPAFSEPAPPEASAPASASASGSELRVPAGLAAPVLLDSANRTAPGRGEIEGLDATEFADAVLRRVELQFEARLREALAPALARAADTLIREARDDVALTLREAVQVAIERELGRRSGR